MEIIFGALSIRDLDSFLVPQSAWLLMSGFPDARQAARAATNFIVNVRKLESGDHVAVTGLKRMVGQQPAIEMTAINLAGPLAAHFIASDDFQADLANAEPEVTAMFSTTAAAGGKGAAKATSSRSGKKDRKPASQGRR
jgi:hypothetical protein